MTKTKYLMVASYTLLLSATGLLASHEDHEYDIKEAPRGNFFFRGYEKYKGNLEKDFLVIKLEKAYISKVSKPDPFSKEEGDIKIQIGPEKTTTTLYWSGNTHSRNINRGLAFDYHGSQTLYVAPVKGLDRLEFKVSVTENDEGDSQKWQKASDIIAKAGESSGSIPVYGSLISGGLTVTSDILELVAQSYQSTTELAHTDTFFDSQEIKLGLFSLGYKSNTENRVADIRLDFMLSTFKGVPLKSLFKRFVHDAKGPVGVEIILNDIIIPSDISAKIWKRRFRKNKGQAIFELNVGGTTNKWEVSTNAFFEDRFKVTNFTAYKGEWVNSGIPASVSLAYTKKGYDFSPLVSSAAEFMKTAIQAEENSKKEVIRDTTISLTQTISSSVLASMSPETQHTLFSVGTQLLKKKRQSLIFPMYSDRGQVPLGEIEAKFKLRPYILPTPDEEKPENRFNLTLENVKEAQISSNDVRIEFVGSGPDGGHLKLKGDANMVMQNIGVIKKQSQQDFLFNQHQPSSSSSHEDRLVVPLEKHKKEKKPQRKYEES